MHLQTVTDQLRAMRLTTMADALNIRLKNGDASNLEPAEFVAILVDEEYSSRQRRKLERMIGRANFKPDQATIENIIYEPERGLAKKDIVPFSTAEWIEQCRNIVITGSTGCGKSYLAEAIGYRACTLGVPSMKIRYNILFEEIHSAKGTGQYLKFLARIAKVKVLILDDFLMNTIDSKDAEMLMDVIEEKDQTGSIIITSQFPVDKWHQRLPDPTIADAICDRLIHNATIINLKGDSMRKEQRNSHAK